MEIDLTNSLPLYAQIETILAAGIAAGEWPPGTELPTEESLIARFAVSRTTIHMAIQNLTRRGLVEVHPGKGTFVAPTEISQNLTGLTCFVEDIQALGLRATARLFEQQVVPASEAVAAQLEVVAGSPVVRVPPPTATWCRSTKPICRGRSANR